MRISDWSSDVVLFRSRQRIVSAGGSMRPKNQDQAEVGCDHQEAGVKQAAAQGPKLCPSPLGDRPTAQVVPATLIVKPEFLGPKSVVMTPIIRFHDTILLREHTGNKIGRAHV